MPLDSKPITLDCIHRRDVCGHPWCAHPAVTIAWANNFLDIYPTGQPKDRPERCDTCRLRNSATAAAREEPKEYVKLTGICTYARDRGYRLPTPSTDCVHRGDVARLTACATCPGSVK